MARSDAMQLNETATNEITPSQRLTAIGIGLLGVMGAATAFTTIRWIGKRAHPMISVNYLAGWTTLISALVLQFYPGIDFQLPSTSREWGLLIFLGICGFLMQILFTAGLQQEKNSRATNMVYTQMLFAVLFDKLLWNSTLTGWSVAGSAIILTSAIYIALQNSSRMTNKIQGRADETERLLWPDEEGHGSGDDLDEDPRRADEDEEYRIMRT